MFQSVLVVYLYSIYTIFYFSIFISSLLITIFGSALAFSVNYPETYLTLLNLLRNCKYIIENINNLDEQIIISPCNQYYTYKGIHYDIAFPIFWVLHEYQNTGPHQCGNCKDYGTFRGVFLMYCANCAKYHYDNEVGYGAIEPGSEFIEGNDIEKSAWNTYLKNRELQYIGLPEELENIDFNLPGYKYKLKYETDDDGSIIKCYPDFIEDSDETEDTWNDVPQEDDDFDMADDKSTATEPIY